MKGVTAACPTQPTVAHRDDAQVTKPDPYAAPKAEVGTEGAAQGGSRAGSIPWVLSTYFAEGLPYSLVHQVIAQQYFTDAGLAFSALGLTALLHAPWNAKFLWAPLVDRIGSSKRWLVGAQLTIAALLLVAAALSSRSAIMPMAVLLVAMAFTAATNDIAIDTYYMRALSSQRQASFTGLRVMAYRGALVAGNGGLVIIAGFFGWPTALVCGALLLGACAVTHATLLAADPPGEARGLPLLDTVLSFFKKPGIGLSLAFIATFKAGDALMFAMNAPLLKALGLGTAERGFYYGTLGTSASVAGSILGGLIAARGLARWLTPIAIVQSLAILLYVAMAAYRPALPVIAAIVIVEQLVAGIGSAAFVVFILRLCDGPHKATHFAFGTALMSFAVTGAGSASGFILERLGFTWFFTLAFVASIPGVLLAPLVARPRTA